MRPPTPTEQAQDDPHRVRLALLLSHEHPLYQLAEAIDWTRFEADLGALYTEAVGRPGLPTRLMVGLHYLKYLFDESDESVVAKFVENPYWQHFCGCLYFEHELPCHPTRPGQVAAPPRRRRRREVAHRDALDGQARGRAPRA